MMNVTADSLTRNDQVVISSDELPYLVDAVLDTPNGRVRVTYSSGDTVEYAAKDEVSIVGEPDPEVMVGTPRLDSLAASGTGEVFDGIRLADGHVLTLKVGPGAEAAEVFLFPGLTAPDTEAWENEDQWEVWLTGGEFGDGSLYLDVPVEAVRDLIVQHGGEHENQEAPYAPEVQVVTTPRFDRLAAIGTGPAVERVHLADGQGIAIRTRPGADTVAEVFVSGAMTIPGIEAGESVKRLDGWLTVGRLVERRCYLDVPVEAVHALIVRHGGEHADQGPSWTIPATADGLTPQQRDALAEIADLRGRFKDGYSAEDIRTVFSRIYDAGGPYLVCVWDYADEAGFGGNSQFYVEDDNGDFHEAQPDVHQWLSGQQETPEPFVGWVGAPATPIDYSVSDDFHNYGRVDRSE